MKIYEYRKHLINGQVRDPDFITQGGHWYELSSDTYIAIMSDNLPYYVPDTLTVLTTDELVKRVQNLHIITPFKKRIGVMGSGGIESSENMTNADVEKMVTDWLNTI